MKQSQKYFIWMCIIGVFITFYFSYAVYIGNQTSIFISILLYFINIVIFNRKMTLSNNKEEHSKKQIFKNDGEII